MDFRICSVNKHEMLFKNKRRKFIAKEKKYLKKKIKSHQRRLKQRLLPTNFFQDYDNVTLKTFTQLAAIYKETAHLNLHRLSPLEHG